MRRHPRASMSLSRLFTTLIALLLVALASAGGPSQFCRLGLHDARIDFCMAVSLYHNHSSAAHDLYLSLSVRRPAAVASEARLGWTAIGTGSRMHGSLMFVAYGDPEAPADGTGNPPLPVLSLRTTEKKHSRPLGIGTHAAEAGSGAQAESFAAAVDARVLDAKWLPPNPMDSSNNQSWTAQFSVVCYSCSNWNGDPIAVESASQPWIWAWNSDQDMSPYALDTEMHRHDLSKDGFGIFYVDMKSAATHHADDAMPAIHGNANVQASETPILPGATKGSLLDSLADRPLAHLHGLLMSTAFLALFPAGAVAIRSTSSRAFTHHWAIQASGVVLALLGAAVAAFMTRGDLFGSPHQIAGSVISCLVLLQAALGWRHHIDFLRIRRRTAISYAHISLGFVILLAGWLNLLAGMILFGFGGLAVIPAAGLIALEAVCLGTWSVLARRRRQQRAAIAKETSDAAAAYFALHDIDSDDDEDGNDDDNGIVQAGEERKGLMKKT